MVPLIFLIKSNEVKVYALETLVSNGKGKMNIILGHVINIALDVIHDANRFCSGYSCIY